MKTYLHHGWGQQGALASSITGQCDPKWGRDEAAKGQSEATLRPGRGQAGGSGAKTTFTCGRGERAARWVGAKSAEADFPSGLKIYYVSWSEIFKQDSGGAEAGMWFLWYKRFRICRFFEARHLVTGFAVRLFLLLSFSLHRELILWRQCGHFPRSWV